MDSSETERADGIRVTVVEGRVYLDMPRYMPVVLSAQDKFRKGIEVGLCPKCGEMKNLNCSQGDISWCMECEIRDSISRGDTRYAEMFHEGEWCYLVPKKEMKTPAPKTRKK
jgi:hypothetical protein